MATSNRMLASWLEAYGRSWEANDGGAFAALFTPDAVYSESPFAEPMVGTDAIATYAGMMEQHQGEVSFNFEIVSVDPPVALFGASYRNTANDEPTRLDGVFLLAFDDDGRCSSLREWWHADPGPAFQAGPPG